MDFVARTVDPWDVPVRQAVEVMQKIWDATSTHRYEITSSTAVYQKVCDCSSSNTILTYMFQTVQRCADSWRNVVGSAGIASLLAFFDSHEDFQESDEERQEFARYLRKDYRFLYKNSEHEDKEVLKSHLVHMLIIKQCFTEMDGALSQPLNYPDIRRAPHSYGRC
jgi:hypothetical protein